MKIRYIMLFASVYIQTAYGMEIKQLQSIAQVADDAFNQEKHIAPPTDPFYFQTKFQPMMWANINQTFLDQCLKLRDSLCVYLKKIGIPDTNDFFVHLMHDVPSLIKNLDFSAIRIEIPKDIQGLIAKRDAKEKGFSENFNKQFKAFIDIIQKSLLDCNTVFKVLVTDVKNPDDPSSRIVTRCDLFVKTKVDYKKTDMVYQLPGLYQAYNTKYYKFLLGDSNATNLCGWYALFFLKNVINKLNVLGTLRDDINSRDNFNNFLNNLVGSGKALNILKTSNNMSMISSEIITKIASNIADFKQPIVVLGLYEGQLLDWVKFGPDYEQNEKAVKAGKFDDIKDLKLEVYKPDFTIDKIFPVIIHTGTKIVPGHLPLGHWIAGVLHVDNTNKITMYVADSLGIDRSDDPVVKAVYDWFSKAYEITQLITSLTKLKQQLGMLSQTLQNMGS